jgi:hypothetical protein
LCFAPPVAAAFSTKSLKWPFASFISPVCHLPWESAFHVPLATTVILSPVGAQATIFHVPCASAWKPKPKMWNVQT